MIQDTFGAGRAVHDIRYDTGRFSGLFISARHPRLLGSVVTFSVFLIESCLVPLSTITHGRIYERALAVYVFSTLLHDTSYDAWHAK